MFTRINTDLGHLTVQAAGHQEGHFIVGKYETYHSTRATDRSGNRANIKEVFKEGLKEVEIKDTRVPSSDGQRVSPKNLFGIYRQYNQSLLEVKALTSKRLKKCQSRINQAVRDGCLEQYLADFAEAVKKAQQTPFLRGEGARGWRASFDWFVANHHDVITAMDFFTVPTLTFRVLYCFFVIEPGRRKILHFNATEHST
jgi:hypothetical protein